MDLRLRVTRQIDVNVGVQAFWERQVTPGTIAATNEPAATAPAVAATTGSEIGYLGVTARLPTLHF
jgi:hypothetical protein